MNKNIDEIKKNLMDEADVIYQKGYNAGVQDTEDRLVNAYAMGTEDKLEENAAYRKGLEDAWKMVRKIFEFSLKDRRKIFQTIYVDAILSAYSVTEAKAKYDAWKQRQDEIKIGDEVQDGDGDRYIVTEIRTDGDFCDLSCMRNDGHGYSVPSKRVKKTGRHFDQIEEVLKQMGKPE